MSLNQDLDPLTLRKVFAQHPSGVAALCTVLDGEKTGLVASSFTVGVSLEPALVMFAVQKTSNTWPKLRTADRIGVSVLSERNDGVCGQIASKHGDRFAGVETHETEQGALFIQESTLWLETSIYNEVEAGDHWVIFLEVHGHDFSNHSPQIFHDSRFHSLPVPEFV
ncbi:flavin reductase family protein [Glutamicibacter protophormiae]|uniref:flavin reductase family protein n=1 Tax=Glutamicibacter protophormiae TaxID=37930 RepID=UPI0019580FC1|nr:flavin reductase family protein [Glutamicibacter protophormiae]QRQ78604.1 flavin reductase family protein [Glutamicibacter protophormiae]WPR64672.1 flavin reductase family protein [Glutamicibacter protophormiae]WPR68167.1 flavin reductase family protein [Glutamicibacter protophormiae]